MRTVCPSSWYNAPSGAAANRDGPGKNLGRRLGISADEDISDSRGPSVGYLHGRSAYIERVVSELRGCVAQVTLKTRACKLEKKGDSRYGESREIAGGFESGSTG